MNPDNIITVALPGLEVIGIEFIHEIEKALDAAFVPLGFTRAETTKGEETTIKFRQFGRCL